MKMLIYIKKNQRSQISRRKAYPFRLLTASAILLLSLIFKSIQKKYVKTVSVLKNLS